MKPVSYLMDSYAIDIRPAPVGGREAPAVRRSLPAAQHRELLAVNADLKTPGSQAQQELWQKKYYQGVDFDQRAAVDDHRTRLRLKRFQR